MGRLLRKKNPAKKKKRINGESSFPSNNDGTSTERYVSETERGTTVSSAEEKVKPFHSDKKSQALAGYIPESVRKITYQSLQFLREVKAELKKVSWSSRKQTVGSTVVVIILVMIISFFLGTVDIGLSSLIHIVLQ